MPSSDDENERPRGGESRLNDNADESTADDWKTLRKAFSFSRWTADLPSGYWSEGQVLRVRATFGPAQVYEYSVIPTRGP
jgi:hypothetical protein